MPLFGHGHHPADPEQLMYRARCDGCHHEVRFTTSGDPTTALDDMDWIFDDDACTRLLCSRCNPRAPGNRTPIPTGFYCEWRR
jgi:hypothetical protein